MTQVKIEQIIGGGTGRIATGTEPVTGQGGGSTWPENKKKKEFDHESFLYFKRTAVGILCALVFNILLIFVVAIPFHVNLAELTFFSPIISPVQFLIAPKSVLYMTVIMFAISWIMTMHTMQVAWTKIEHLSRVKKGYAILTNWWGVAFPIGYGICGLLLVHCYLGILDSRHSNFSYSGKTCNEKLEPERCVDERHVFILVSTMISSCLYSIRVRFYHLYVIKFPTVEVAIWNKVRVKLLIYLKEAMSEILMYIPTIYACYFVAASPIRKFLSSLTGLHTPDTPFAASDMMDLELFLFVFLGPCFAFISFKICWDVLQICLTMRLEFPIDIDTPVDGQLLLVDALASQEYVRHLGYYDFKCLTERDSYRFGLLFKLSHPGGNPINWIGILTQTFNLIRTSKESMENFISEEKALKRKKSKESSSSLEKNTDNNFIGLYSTPHLVRLANDVDDKITSRQRILYSMRDLSNPPRDEDAELEALWMDAPQEQKPKFKFGEISITKMILNSRLGKYLTQTDREIRIAVIFSNSHLIIWAVQSLVNVCVSSLRYDIEGVIQRDLTTILYTFIDYYETILEFRRLKDRIPIVVEEGTPIQSGTIMAQEDLFNSLRFAVAHLSSTLHNYFDLLNMSKEYIHKLDQLATKGLLPRWMANENK